MSEKPSKFEKCHEKRLLIDDKIVKVMGILNKMLDYNRTDGYDYAKLSSNLSKLDAAYKSLKGLDK